MISNALRLLFLATALLLAPSAARAELVLSQLVVELAPGQQARGDIEVWNNAKERAYVLVEPSEILKPGTPAEQRVTERNPEKLGLLVTPTRMILEPGQTRLLRISAIGPQPAGERVYRVTVKPTVGEIEAEQSGLKLLIGYDVLVLRRPAPAKPQLAARREGGQLVIRNTGPASVELAAGKACTAKETCQSLGGKRLYSGAEWRVDVPAGVPAEFSVIAATGTSRQVF